VPRRRHRLAALLTLDPPERRRAAARRRSGPRGHPSLVIEQIDYERSLAREEGAVAEPAKRDDLWRSIVMSICRRQKRVFDERAQERLLAIAGSRLDIGDLATAVPRPNARSTARR
jgi:hypothetical protein